ncbi:FGGY-family carbohydrate kinase [Blastococcus sp. TF02A-30]|uniref:FGGY-family carbohydrate kinase n=1 Tax=Blastococcus sp. TF02A-30 TaxID=2250580 RepID=UPI002100E5C7|nr:FGGY-family carbohydrate kinase [Blastococcus sp. TF02A-30]
MTGPVLAWLAAHEPDVVGRAAAVLLPKDALRVAVARGPLVTDRSDASATLLWDVPGDGWSEPATAAAGVRRDLLPGVRPADDVVGTATLAGAEVPVVVGGADTPLALLAAGTTGGAQVNLGTGAQVLRPGWDPVPVEDPVVHGYAQVLAGWYSMAALQNGGSAWAWVRQVLGLTWAEFFEAAASTGPTRVVFRPFLTGERGGVAGPHDRGGWSGLEEGTTRAELVRAAVEGVVFAIDAALKLLDLPGNGAPLVLTGGGGRAPVVRRLLADVTGRRVRWSPLRSASAIGAALLAARGTGAEVVPAGEGAAVVEPSRDAGLDAARERWRAG